MITWMQKHRKYLVITIWISTIAFVGAGFVGWGAYNFGPDNASNIAQVGDETISVKEFQQTYGNLYSYYNNLSNGQLTQEKAKAMGLENIVLNSLIDQALLLNFAQSLGLSVLDKDIEKALIEDKNFQENGVFNKEQYYKVLRTIGLTAKEYENSLKKQILLQKLTNIINLPANQNEIKMLTSSVFMQDKLKLKVIEASDKDVNITDEELKKAWESSKNAYLTQTIYNLKTTFIPAKTTQATEKELNEFYEENKLNYRNKEDKIESFQEALSKVKKDYDLKQTKNEALDTYLKIKKDEIQPKEMISIKDNSEDTVLLDKVKTAKVGETIKPFEYKDGYLVVKVDGIEEPKPMEFEEAKPMVEKVLLAQKIREYLEAQAKKDLKSFDGENIGFVSRDDIKKTVSGLSESEFANFLAKVFDNKNKQGYVVFDKKAVIYDILEQNLLDNNKLKEYEKLMSENMKQLKNDEIRQNILEELRKKYSIEQFYKGN